jgi:hypothetical protein
MALLTTITLEAVPFCTYALFPPLLLLSKCILEVLFSEGVQHCLCFCLDHLNCAKMAVSSIGETEKAQGAIRDEKSGQGLTVMLLVKKFPVEKEVCDAAFL